MNKCVVLFVEGETEVCFYKKLIDYLRNKCSSKQFDVCCEIKNVKGVGNFKKDALRKFDKDIKKKYNKHSICAVLCSDTDVFEISPRPALKWNEVIKDFYDSGAKNVIHIEAYHSIEDWFLYDLEGILTYLHLPKTTKAKGSNGYEKLTGLFKQGKKIYYKGTKCTDFLEHLNMDIIYERIYKNILPLIEELDCNF